MGATLALAVLFSGGVSFANEKQNGGYMYTIDLLEHSINYVEGKFQLEIDITGEPDPVDKFKYSPFWRQDVGIDDLVKAWDQDDPNGFYKTPNAVLNTNYANPDNKELNYEEMHIKLTKAVHDKKNDKLIFDVEPVVPCPPEIKNCLELANDPKTGFLYIDGRSNFQCPQGIL